MEQITKEAWVQEQHDKAVKVHHANMDRIERLDLEINKKVSRINSLYVAENFLQQQKIKWANEGGEYNETLQALTGWFETEQVCSEIFDEGIEALRKTSISLSIEIANLQAEIDTHTWDDSVKIMQEDSDKEKLRKEYDAQFGTQEEA